MKRFESFGLDTANECLWQNEVQIALPPRPFSVLRYLVENPGRLITQDEILDALWPETFVQPQVIRTYVLELRKILGDDARQPRFIQTLPKRGYRFIAKVTEDAAAISPTPSPSPAAASAEIERRTTGIVDRKEESERLMKHAQRAASGQRQTVFVSGETGIGKTALVDAFCLEASSAWPLSIARGQCVESMGRKEANYPVLEAIRNLCTSPDGEAACRVLARLAPAWLNAIGRADDSAAGASRIGGVELTVGELCAALEELAQAKPLILIFEDLHWADDSTLDLISAMARRRARAQLMVIATFRPRDAVLENALKELKQDLLVRRLGIEIALAPLAKSAVVKLLGRELQDERLPAGLADFVHRHSEGNPLFAIAILEHLIAQHFLVRDGGNGASRWAQHAPLEEMDARVPDELAQMIELEIARLAERDQRILEAASLVSVAFPAWAVAAALNEDAAESEESCDDVARRLYFVHRAGQDELPDGSASGFYAFAHELYREVLYRRQPSTRRVRGHNRIADRLGELFAGRTGSVAREMAMHYEAAGNWPRAAAALQAAATHALDREAAHEAEHLLERALQVAENLGRGEREAALLELRAQLDSARAVAGGR